MKHNEEPRLIVTHTSNFIIKCFESKIHKKKLRVASILYHYSLRDFL
jgi:hypothetical protein